jgi:hypothetical protein
METTSVQAALLGGQTAGAAGKRRDDGGQWLAKRDAGTGAVEAEKTPEVESQHDEDVRPGKVGYGALIATMEAGRFATTSRAAGGRLAGGYDERHALGGRRSIELI